MKKIQIGDQKFNVVKEYYGETYHKEYLLLEDTSNHELFVCSKDEEGYIHEITSKDEMKMLEIVFGE